MFLQIFPAFDAAVNRSESKNGVKGLKISSLLRINNNFGVNVSLGGKLEPLVLETNVRMLEWHWLILFDVFRRRV